MAIQIQQSDVARLKEVINEGVETKNEIEALRDGLKETVNGVADEMGIPKALLNKAINIAHKGNFDDQQDELESLQQILQQAGYCQ